MNDDEDDDIGWEDDDQQVDGEEVAWEEDGDQDGDQNGYGDEGHGGESPVQFEIEDVAEEPEERRWLGDDGEIVVELPREEEVDGDGGDGGDGDGGGEREGVEASGKGKGKAKVKPRRFTAEETRQALDLHKAHLACLVARCAMVSRWAGDPTVQAAMVSCLPGHLLSKESVSLGQRAGAKKTKSEEEEGEEEEQQQQRQGHEAREKLTLANLVVWFRAFITVLDDSAVGAGGERSRGSRPSRLLRVIEQRAGSAHEAAQLFVSLCRGLGLRARYVACLDPVPPTPSSSEEGPSSKQRRNNTVDLTTAAGDRRGRRKQHAGRGAPGGGPEAERGGAGFSQAWAEVLCQDDGKELYVVAGEKDCPSKQPPPPRPSASPRRPSKRHRTAPLPSPPPPGSGKSTDQPRADGSGSEPVSLSGDEERNAGTVVEERHGNSGKRRRTQREGQPPPPSPQAEQQSRGGSSKDSKDFGTGRPETDAAATQATAAELGASARPTRAGAKRKTSTAKARAAIRTARTARTKGGGKAGCPDEGAGEAADSLPAETEAGKQVKGAGDDAAEKAADPLHGGSGAGDLGAAVNGVGGVDGGGVRKRGRKGSGGGGGGGGSSGGSSNSSKSGAGASAGACGSSSAGGVRERWVHVDPVQGAVDQPDKVQDLRFRKRLMPYVVAEDENKLIVDVTRRYSSDWGRTLRTRGRAMASADGWWNSALRQWGASSAAERNKRKTKQAGTGTAESPLVLEADERNREAVEDPRASEEKELQEKVNKEPIPSTIAGLKNHHMYVLGKSLLKFEALRPGAKAAGLVKGSKVYLKSDVAKLRGASRWKKDSLQVRESELGKPAKVATKKGEKDGEGTSKLYGEWQTEPWVPKPAVGGKVPKNEYGNVEFFDCSPAFLPPGTEHVRGDQIGRVAAKLGVDYAPALTGFESKQGRQVPVLDGIIVCREQSQMLREAHMTWQQTLLEKQAKARVQKVLRRWRTLFQGVLLGAQLLEEYGDHN
eukprot:g3781.t1